MKILVCGDRHQNESKLLEEYFGYLFDYFKRTGKTVTIVEGECPNGGIDILARNLAGEYSFSCIPMPAEWSKFGRAAGPKRNQQMLDENPDIELVVAVHRRLENSRGTRDMINKAYKAKLPIMILIDAPDEH